MDHFLILTNVSLAWLCYRLSSRAVEDFEGAFSFPHTSIFKIQLLYPFEKCMIGMWSMKLLQIITKSYSWIWLCTSPIILHSNKKILERWPDFYPFSVFSNIVSNLSFPFIFLHCSTYRLIMYLWNATINKTSDSVVNFRVYYPSLDVKITSSLSQHVLAHTKATHRQHLFLKNGITLKINVSIRHQPSEKISFLRSCCYLKTLVSTDEKV